MLKQLLEHRYAKWVALVVLLVLANVISYLWSNWGLITVKVRDVPLSKVVRSIEWQGWVKIYTNLPPDTKVSMWVDHVPLAEAMETLSQNVGGAPNGAADRPDRPDRPPRERTVAASTVPPAGGPPPDGAPPGGPGAGGPPPDGGPGGAPGAPGARGNRGGFPRGGGGFGGGFGGGAQWNLAFFVAPTSAEVKKEIAAFVAGTTDDNTRVYSYPTPIQMVSGDETPAADPRLQSWSGVRPPDPVAPPAPPPADGSTPPPAPETAPVADTTPPPPSVQTYLQGFAEASNIWIMAPGTWDPAVATPPPPNASIIGAVKKFVSRANGSVTQAIILRVGRGGGRGPGGPGGRGGGFAFGGGNPEAMADRMRNALNGLPEEARAEALDNLNQEVKFYQDVKAAPPEQRRKMVEDHMAEKIANGPGNNRASPEKRAARMARAVANREAATGKK